MSEFTFSKWQWNPEKETWDYWHEPSNLIIRVWGNESDGWRWEILEFDGTEADPLVVASYEDDIPFPLVSKEAAQTAALAWLESDHD